MSNISSVDSSNALSQAELRTARQAEDRQEVNEQRSDRQVQQAEDRVDLSDEAQRLSGERGNDVAETNERIEGRAEARVEQNRETRAAQEAESQEGGSANDVTALLNSGQGGNRLGNNIDTAV